MGNGISLLAQTTQTATQTDRTQRTRPDVTLDQLRNGGGYVRQGDGSASTRQIQERLVAHGYRVAVDQSFGPETEAAVRRFQRDHSLREDGIVGRNTIAALERAPQCPPGAIPAMPATPASPATPEVDQRSTAPTVPADQRPPIAFTARSWPQVVREPGRNNRVRLGESGAEQMARQGARGLEELDRVSGDLSRTPVTSVSQMRRMEEANRLVGELRSVYNDTTGTYVFANPANDVVRAQDLERQLGGVLNQGVRR